jgi:hypothetical protein
MQESRYGTAEWAAGFLLQAVFPPDAGADHRRRADAILPYAAFAAVAASELT